MSTYKRPVVRKKGGGASDKSLGTKVYDEELNKEIQRFTNLGIVGTYNQLAGIARASLRGKKRAENERARIQRNKERMQLLRQVRKFRGGKRFNYKPTLVLFSGTAEKSEPDLKALFIKKLDPMVHEVSVMSGKTVLATHTREYGIKTLSKRLPYDSLGFKGTMGRRAFYLRLFKSGKCTFTGGYRDGAVSLRKDPMSLVRSILGTVNSFELKYCMSEIDTGYRVRPGVRPDTLFSVMAEALPNYVNQMKFSAPVPGASEQPFVSVGPIRVFPNGKMQLSEFTTEAEYSRVKAEAGIVINILDGFGIFEKRNSNLPKGRATRAQTRYSNQIAPNIKSRATTCPKNRRPVPYSFGGEPIGPGWYVGANPQGQPCCYKIPKTSKNYMRPKIVQRFANLGIRIPQSAKNAFGIQLNNSNNPVNVSGKEPNALKFSILGDTIYYGKKRASQSAIKRASELTGKSGDDLIKVLKVNPIGEYSVVPNLKIGTRMADRWTLPRLVDVAQRLGITYVSKSSSKLDVILAIAKHAPLNSVQQNTFRVGNKRNAAYMKKSNLIKRAMNIYRVNVSGEKTLKNMIAKLKSTVNLRTFESTFKNMVPKRYHKQLYASAKNTLVGKSKAEIRNVLQRMVGEIPITPVPFVPPPIASPKKVKTKPGFTNAEKNAIRTEYLKNLPVEEWSEANWKFMLKRKPNLAKGVKQVSTMGGLAPMNINIDPSVVKYLKTPERVKRLSAKANVEVM